MRHHDDRDAEVAVDVLDPESHVLALLGVQPGGRLVEQQQLRLQAERAAHLHDLAHSVGQVRDPLLPVVGELQEVDDVFHAAPVLELLSPHRGEEQEMGQRRRAPVDMTADEEVLQDGGVLEELDVLEGARQAERRDAMRRQRGDVAAREPNAPAVGGVDAAHQVEERRLAGSVRSDDGEHLALLDVEAHVVDGTNAPEADRQVLDGEVAHLSRSVRR